jgi:hypothetical protein
MPTSAFDATMRLLLRQLPQPSSGGPGKPNSLQLGHLGQQSRLRLAAKRHERESRSRHPEHGRRLRGSCKSRRSTSPGRPLFAFRQACTAATLCSVRRRLRLSREGPRVCRLPAGASRIRTPGPACAGIAAKRRNTAILGGDHDPPRRPTENRLEQIEEGVVPRPGLRHRPQSAGIPDRPISTSMQITWHGPRRTLRLSLR